MLEQSENKVLMLKRTLEATKKDFSWSMKMRKEIWRKGFRKNEWMHTASKERGCLAGQESS